MRLTIDKRQRRHDTVEGAGTSTAWRLTAVIVAVCVVVSSLMTVQLLSRRAEASSGSVMLRWGSTQGGSQAVTAAQAVADAQLVDTIVGLPNTFGPYTAQMRAANPRLKLIFYMNGTYATGANQNTYPESDYLHDARGSRVYSVNFNNPLMDATNPDWIQSRVTTCSAALASLGWDGCYLDMLGPGTFTPTYLTATPINTATGQVWSTADWIAATSRLAATVTTSLPSSIIVGNGIENGTLYVDPGSGPTATLWNGLSGGNAQSFVRGDQDPATAFRTEAKWRQDVDMLIDAGQRGKSVMAQAKVWLTGITQAQKDAIHRYALATFLLGTDGHQYWYFSDTGSESAVVPDTPYDHVDVGTPIGSYAKLLGAYQRRYTGGLVVVNPTPLAVTFPLPSGQWTTLDGAVLQGQMTLQPNSGDVLKASTAWATLPTATTGTVSNVTPTSATISGTVNPKGLATNAYAEYGPFNTLGTITSPVAVASGTATKPVQIKLTGLTPGTTYTYHVDANSAAGTAAGVDFTFSTPLPPPVARTGGTALNLLVVTVTGFINPNGLPTTFHVEFGMDTTYGSASGDFSAGSGKQFVTENVVLLGTPLAGLLHYRFVATNSTGTSFGSDRTVRIL
jgi:hypothetical protein